MSNKSVEQVQAICLRSNSMPFCKHTRCYHSSSVAMPVGLKNLLPACDVTYEEWNFGIKEAGTAS